MHSKRRHKNCICSVILGELELSEITRASVFKNFPKNLDAVERFVKVRIFLIPLYHIFESEILGFLF